MNEDIEHTCQFCYYEYFDGRAYPCSMCVCGEERKDMFQPKGKQNKRKDEPQTETKIKTQNSNLTFEKAEERCRVCNHYKLTCDLFSEICRYEPMDEPQTDCAWKKSEEG